MKWKRTAPVMLALVVSGCAGSHPSDTAQSYPYHFPITSPGAKFAGLPPAVQQTIRAEAGTARMRDILKVYPHGQTVYEVLFQNSDTYPPLFVASDGSVLYPNFEVAVTAEPDEFGALSGGPRSGVRAGDLPAKVTETINNEAPTAEVAFINKITIGDKNYYQVTFRDPAHHPALYISEDGTLMKRGPEAK